MSGIYISVIACETSAFGQSYMAARELDVYIATEAYSSDVPHPPMPVPAEGFVRGYASIPNISVHSLNCGRVALRFDHEGCSYLFASPQCEY